ncbi:MAG: hypothetical protein VX976_03520 [Pseudomonadota bacterium]|nr:hypothetical protein [Pseudomonadota bacterium]
MFEKIGTIIELLSNKWITRCLRILTIDYQEFMQNVKEISYSEILNSKSYYLYANGDLIEGINLFSEIVQLNPHDSNIWVELGYAYLKNIDFEMAKKCFETAFEINPRNANAVCALGLYYYESGNLEKAKEFYYKTLQIDPNSSWGKLNLSLLEQVNGNNLRGLALYEEREKEKCLVFYKDPLIKEIPELTRLDDLTKNKNILIIGEQGFGDQLMTCMYLKKLHSIGIKLTFLVNEKLFPLLNQVKDLKEIKISEELSKNELKKFHLKIYSMSLPYLFEMKKLKRMPVIIKSNESKKKNTDYPNYIKQLLSKKSIKVGLAWSGRPTQTRNSFRSIKLDFFSRILDNKEIDFFSLQKISNNFEKDFIYKKNNFFDVSNYLEDFRDTTFFVSKMDIIISTCTSLVHLSGLMKKKTMLLLSYTHDPRWNEKTNGNLYGTVEKFKQRELNNWYHPLNEINTVLENLNKNE